MAERGTTSKAPRQREVGTEHAEPGMVEVSDAGGRLAPAAAAWLEAKAREALRVLGVGGEVRVRVVGDGEMGAAHSRYAGVAGTTDVLTFDLGEGGPLDADLLVCADEAARQAAARGHPPERELLLYVLHGVLHCLGHDDHDEAAAAAMHACEDEVLTAIGVGPTYARGEGG
jgi:probable rRNA maturation factor